MQEQEQYFGLLGPIAEASDIKAELDCSLEEAWRVQKMRSTDRSIAYETRRAFDALSQDGQTVH